MICFCRRRWTTCSHLHKDKYHNTLVFVKYQRYIRMKPPQSPTPQPHRGAGVNGSWKAIPSERMLWQVLPWWEGFQVDPGVMIMDRIPRGQLGQCGEVNRAIDSPASGWYEHGLLQRKNMGLITLRAPRPHLRRRVRYRSARGC